MGALKELPRPNLHLGQSDMQTTTKAADVLGMYATNPVKAWDIHKAKAAHRKKRPDCQFCGAKSGVFKRKLDVHHIKPVKYYPELAADPRNLITVCRRCHLRECHFGDWHSYNKDIIGLAAEYKMTWLWYRSEHQTRERL